MFPSTCEVLKEVCPTALRCVEAQTVMADGVESRGVLPCWPLVGNTHGPRPD